MSEVKEEIEYETVQVKVPKAIMDLLRDFVEDPEEYLMWLIVDSVKSVLEADFSNGGQGEIISLEKIVKRYGLDRVFNDC